MPGSNQMFEESSDVTTNFLIGRGFHSFHYSKVTFSYKKFIKSLSKISSSRKTFIWTGFSNHYAAKMAQKIKAFSFEMFIK